MADAPARRKVTINTLNAKMKKGEPITQLAAYDYRTAVVSDRLGMDILCVSDTGGMILFGHQSTVTVSFDEVMMMAKAIDRGSKYGLRMVDMPYWSFHVSPEQAVDPVEIGDDPAGQPGVHAIMQGADVFEVTADRGEIAVVPPPRGGQHRGRLAIMGRDIDHHLDDITPLPGDL